MGRAVRGGCSWAVQLEVGVHGQCSNKYISVN